MTDTSPLIFVFTGPSGVGKTTACIDLAKRDDVERIVTTTTREPRQHEEDGLDYLFMSLEEIAEKEHSLLPNIEYAGNTYGYPSRCFKSRFERGKHCAIAVKMGIEKCLGDVYGKDRVVSVLLLPPSLNELEQRLRGDNRPPETIQRRLDTARKELNKDRSHFDEIVESDGLDDLYRTLDLIYNRYTR